VEEKEMDYLRNLNKVYLLLIALSFACMIFSGFYTPSYSVEDLTKIVYMLFFAYMTLIFTLAVMIDDLEIRILKRMGEESEIRRKGK
jgi:hypothetical protein